ncbi:MAG: hypothetical protein ABI726_06880 [bacterium]
MCAWELPAMTYAGGYVAEKLPGKLEEAAQRTLDEALERAGADRVGPRTKTRAIGGLAVVPSGWDSG